MFAAHAGLCAGLVSAGALAAIEAVKVLERQGVAANICQLICLMPGIYNGPPVPVFYRDPGYAHRFFFNQLHGKEVDAQVHAVVTRLMPDHTDAPRPQLFILAESGEVAHEAASGSVTIPPDWATR
jgi:hypothetical protein